MAEGLSWFSETEVALGFINTLGSSRNNVNVVPTWSPDFDLQQSDVEVLVPPPGTYYITI